MQLFADVTGREVGVAGLPRVPGWGAALAGSVVASQAADSFGYIKTAVASKHPAPSRSPHPNAAANATYAEVCITCRHLHDEPRRESVEWLHRLKGLHRHLEASQG